jgi:hypothetical protein
MTCEVGCRRQWWGWKTVRGARLSLVKGVGVGKAEARWRLRAPSSAPAQGRRVRGERVLWPR